MYDNAVPELISVRFVTETRDIQFLSELVPLAEGFGRSLTGFGTEFQQATDYKALTSLRSLSALHVSHVRCCCASLAPSKCS